MFTLRLLMALVSFSGEELVCRHYTDEEFTGHIASNGKRVYRKELIVDNIPAGNMWYNHNLNIDTYEHIDSRCYVANQEQNIRPLPYWDGSGRIWIANLEDNRIAIFASWGMSKAWITLKYTKK